MDALHGTYVKLLAFDFLSLKLHSHRLISSSEPTFLRNGRPISRAETVGVVVSWERKESFLRFCIDDGTGCIPCILWLNHLSRGNPYYAGKNPLDLELAFAYATQQADHVQLGKLARVRGRVTHFRSCLQITVSSVIIEKDPNMEILHWLDCMRLANRCYDQPSPAQ